jgi:hypothetical protein
MANAKPLMRVDFLYKRLCAERITASQHLVTNGIFSHGMESA